MKKRDKQFLNESLEEFGMVGWSVRTKDDIEWGCDLLSAELIIKDCSNTITLDFDCEKQPHVQKRIDKLETLINSLTDFRDALVEAKQDITNKKFYY